LAQTETSALGRLVGEGLIRDLPLVTRNLAQISSLSPGVISGVFNAGELGMGSTAQSQITRSNGGLYIHGARSYQNNWQLDGISVSDVQGTGSASGGVPLPNPDAVQEFKVQTGLYDASFGRYGGANISVVTKTGTNDYHGTVFEFLRNDALNANDFFLKRGNQPRPVLKQNQFGFSLGGPIKKDKLLFFGSYQGTRQINGVASGQARIACTATLNSPPLTNDRSAATLGNMFGGLRGAQGGVAVQPDGSNINSVALALLNFRLPDGSFLIPTPQVVDPSKVLVVQGFSAFSQPCRFGENQSSVNIDYVSSPKSRIAARFLHIDSNQNVSFPGGAVNMVGNIRGFGSPSDSTYVVFSLSNSYAFSSDTLNEARVGFVRARTATAASAPLKWSDVGVTAGPMNHASLPSLNILGSVSFTPAVPRAYIQNSFVLSDTFSLLRGAHTMMFGGSLTRLQDNVRLPGVGSFVQFLSWPDFLLGLDASANGTDIASNVFASADLFGLLDRSYRVWEASAFAQDSVRVSRSLTLNLGMRYERLGQFGDEFGRNSSFDISEADHHPPPSGSLAGYMVASNFQGTVPPGVVRADNSFGNLGMGQNTFAPRFGLAWQVSPNSSHLVVRGGYGIFFSRPTGQAFTASVLGAPFGLFRFTSGPVNKGATFQAPFQQPFPTPDSFPFFVKYSAGSQATISTVAPRFRPAMTQQFSLNLQSELHPGWLLEAAYVGSRGLHLQRFRSVNQALEASPSNPINGLTSNTVSNIPLRVPIPGIPADSLRQLDTDGHSWYNGLEMSLANRPTHGLQLLASYTFSKTLDTDGADVDGSSAGNTLTRGDQNSPRQRWGRASFDRTHRLVLSAVWDVPSPAWSVPRFVMDGWSVAAIATIQSGNALTVIYTNSNNVLGISQDRAQLTGACSKRQLLSTGPAGARLNGYFNTACFTTPPVIGSDGIGTAFGNSGTGIVNGPGQANLDMAVSKLLPVKWGSREANVELRVELFNALNHPQFANPDTNLSSPTFGVITNTSTNARVIQLGLKFAF
jgi:hypothetical protein